MKKQYRNRYCRCLASTIALSIMATALPMTALAAPKNKPDERTYQPPEISAPDYNKDLSPEFAYTQDKWAALRDNVMEYGELADLIHEYNPTVRSNRSMYKDQKGKNLNDVYQDYMDDIDLIWDQVSAADDDISEATLRFTAGSLTKQADNNYQDADMEKIQYDQQEAQLVSQAQQLMVSLQQAGYNLETLQNTRDLLQKQYEAVVAQRAAGMATEANVLTALKSVQDQDAAILSAETTRDNVHRNLCLMLGWGADSQPEIREVPLPDLSRIDAMNPAEDSKKALENNYDVKYYQKKDGNLTSQDLKDSNRATLENAKDTVVRSLRTQYNAVLVARDQLNAANMKLQVQETELAKAQAGMAVGQMTALEYTAAENSCSSARSDVKTKELELLLAIEAYDWIVKGLTASN